MCELITLHGLTHDKVSWWDAVFAGAVLFVVYARARWSELFIAAMDFEEDTIAFIDRTWFAESQCNCTNDAVGFNYRWSAC